MMPANVPTGSPNANTSNTMTANDANAVCWLVPHACDKSYRKYRTPATG